MYFSLNSWPYVWHIFYTHTWNNFHSYLSFKTKYIMKRFDNSHVSNHSCDNGHDATAAAPLSWGISIWTYDVTVYIRSRTMQTQTTGPTKLNFCWVIDTSVNAGKIRVLGFWWLSFIKKKPNANRISDILKQFIESVDAAKTRNESRNLSDHSSFFTFFTETMHKL
jgi:hypothetical protein